MAPPFVDAAVIRKFAHPQSLAPTQLPTHAPTVGPTISPSIAPSASPTFNSTVQPNYDDDLSQKTGVNATAAESQLLALQNTLHFYELSAITLLVTLLFSVAVHIVSCFYYCGVSNEKRRSDTPEQPDGMDSSEHLPPQQQQGMQMVPLPTAAASQRSIMLNNSPSHSIASQYAAIPSEGAPQRSGGLLSYLPALGSSTKRLGETPPEPAPRSPAGSPRPPQHQQRGAAVEEEIKDISEWTPPSANNNSSGGGLLLKHTSPKPSLGSYFSRSSSAAAATREEEDFYRDEDDDDDGGDNCTDSSRLLQVSHTPLVDQQAAAKHGGGAKHSNNNSTARGAAPGAGSGSESEDAGYVRKALVSKATKSSHKLKAKHSKH